MFWIGLFLGAGLGIFVYACAVIAGRYDDEEPWTEPPNVEVCDES